MKMKNEEDENGKGTGREKGRLRRQEIRKRVEVWKRIKKRKWKRTRN